MIADFKAGRPVPVLEFLHEAIKAVEADRKRGAARRKPVAASASPDGEVRVSLLGLLRSGVKSLEAASKRAASRRIADAERDEDERIILAALYRLEQAYGEQTYAQRLKQLVSVSGLTGKRVREALRQLVDVRPALIHSESRYVEGVFSCEGCAAVAVDPEDACLLHSSGAAMIEAAATHVERRKSTSASKVGFKPLKRGIPV